MSTFTFSSLVFCKSNEAMRPANVASVGSTDINPIKLCLWKDPLVVFLKGTKAALIISSFHFIAASTATNVALQCIRVSRWALCTLMHTIKFAGTGMRVYWWNGQTLLINKSGYIDFLSDYQTFATKNIEAYCKQSDLPIEGSVPYRGGREVPCIFKVLSRAWD